MILVDFPCIVRKYSPLFEDLFTPEGFAYFQKFVSGFLVCSNKTIEAINRIFVFDKRNQSSANRFFNRQNFDLEQLNERRLQMLHQFEACQFKAQNGHSGVLSLDNSLLKHWGEGFDHIYRLYDHVNRTYTLAHDLVTLHYSDDQTDYPVHYRLWTPPDWEAVAEHLMRHGVNVNSHKREQRASQPKQWRNYIRYRYRDYQDKVPGLKEVYKTKNDLGLELVRLFKHQYPDLDLPIALDTGFTSARVCTALDKELGMAYVGSLREDQKILLSQGREMILGQFTEQLKAQHVDEAFSKVVFQKTNVPFKGKKQTCYTYVANHRIKGYPKKQRLVISFYKSDLSDQPTFSISNRLSWFPSGILRIRRHRWPVETFHQESKAEGLDKYQVRNEKAIQTHIAFVVVAYSMLKCALHDQALLSSIQKRLQTESSGTLPFLRRLLQAESLMLLIEFIMLMTQKGDSLSQIMEAINQQIAYT